MPVWRLTLEGHFRELHHIWVEAPSQKTAEAALPRLQEQWKKHSTRFTETECKTATLIRVSRVKHPESNSRHIYSYTGKEPPTLKSD